jgi:hypothetical protein
VPDKNIVYQVTNNSWYVDDMKARIWEQVRVIDAVGGGTSPTLTEGKTLIVGAIDDKGHVYARGYGDSDYNPATDATGQNITNEWQSADWDLGYFDTEKDIHQIEIAGYAESTQQAVTVRWYADEATSVTGTVNKTFATTYGKHICYVNIRAKTLRVSIYKANATGPVRLNQVIVEHTPVRKLHR